MSHPKIAAARAVFARIKEAFDEHDGECRWLFNLDHETIESIGPDHQTVLSGMSVLKSKGLVEKVTVIGYALTPDGEDACLHPEILDELLSPPTFKQGPTYKIGQVFNSTLGSDNTQHNRRPSGAVFQLAQDIRHVDVDAATRERWMSVLKEIAAHVQP